MAVLPSSTNYPSTYKVSDFTTMSNSIVGEVYQHVILDVIANSRTDFEENGVDEATLQELQNLWQGKLVATNVATFPWAQAPVGAFPIGQLFDPVTGLRTDSLDVAAAAAAGATNSPILNNIAAIRAVQQMDSLAQQHGGSPFYPSPSSAGLNQTTQPDASTEGSSLSDIPNNINTPFTSFNKNTSLQLPSNPNSDNPPNNLSSSVMPPSSDRAVPQDPNLSNNNAFGGLLLPNQNSVKNESPESLQQPGPSEQSEKQDIPQSDGTLLEDDTEEHIISENSKYELAHDADKRIKEMLANNRVLQIDGTFDDNEEEKKTSPGTPSDEAINSDLDDPDSDEAPEADEGSDVGQAIVLCLYDKVNHHKNKWKCVFRDGIVGVNGKDYLFFKANGEFEWI
ncbi:transcription factor TFIIA complex large subunit [Schizosaccharomyces octosporus yFS286]|uniref:Transcription initiation factor IIA large subunit n=1 Tax=Schizosaccharomyces octosporus (strain yFS286) TaxID=483514 RepID=S9PXP4_SCHOY|nr:transcription factor TFIIA complex large subunit [Schizosaccharomyces octosporus yFS286]EPX72238.1 transcription factor TFIIA complex large subunit [Schizosaccharomyces octosporus yFS286]